MLACLPMESQLESQLESQPRCVVLLPLPRGWQQPSSPTLMRQQLQELLPLTLALPSQSPSPLSAKRRSCCSPGSLPQVAEPRPP